MNDRENEWRYIENQKDIDELMETYHFFHDSAIIRMVYEDMGHSDENGTNTYDPGNNRILNIIFKSEWKPDKIELKFAGVRQLHINGYDEQDFLHETHLAFHDDADRYSRERILIWADDENFKPNEIDNALDETRSYVIAERTKWRIPEQSVVRSNLNEEEV